MVDGANTTTLSPARPGRSGARANVGVTACSSTTLTSNGDSGSARNTARASAAVPVTSPPALAGAFSNVPPTLLFTRAMARPKYALVWLGSATVGPGSSPPPPLVGDEPPPVQLQRILAPAEP